MSKWTEFVKDWATKNNTTYGCALSNPKCSADYRKANPTKKQQKEAEAKAEAQADADKRKQMIADEEVRRKAKKEAKAEAERLVAEEKRKLAEEEKRLADEAKKLEEEKKKLEAEAKKKQDEAKAKEGIKKQEAKLRKNILGLPIELKENILGFVDRSISKADLERLIEIFKDADFEYNRLYSFDGMEVKVPKYAEKKIKELNDGFTEVSRLVRQIFELSGNQDKLDKLEEDGELYTDVADIQFSDLDTVGIDYDGESSSFNSSNFKDYVKWAENYTRNLKSEIKKIGKNILPQEQSKEVIKARAKAKAENEKKAEQAKPAKPFEISSAKIGGSSGWKKDYTEDEIKLIEASYERAKTRTKGVVSTKEMKKLLPAQSEVDEAIAKKYGLIKSWTKKAEKLLSSIGDKNGLSGVNYQDVAVRIVEGKIEGGMMRLPSGVNINEINDYLTIPSQEEQDQPMSGTKRRRDDAKTALKNKITRLLERVALIELNPKKRNINIIRATKQKLGNILEELDRLGISEIEDQMEEVDKMEREISGGMIYGGAGEAEIIKQRYNLSQEQWTRIRKSTRPKDFPDIVLTPQELAIRREYDNLKKERNPNVAETRAKATRTFNNALVQKGISRSQYEKNNSAKRKEKDLDSFNFDLDFGTMEGEGMRSSDTCFTEKEVQDSLKKMAEWVKEEPVEPNRNEITAKAKAEITLLKSKKRGFDKAKQSTKPYAYEREAHQQALKEAYPRGRGLTKGSQEAKDWGAKMRAMRDKRSVKPTHKKTTKCCKMCAGKGCYCCDTKEKNKC